IARIRRLIGAEIEVVGLEEVEELAMLADIERQAERMITAFEGLSAVAQPEPLSPAWRTLASQLTEIDGAFRAHLAEALAEEAREVRETADEVREQIFGHQILALIAVLVALATAVAGLYSIQFTLKTRMEALLGGIRSLAEGDLNRRIGLRGRDELTEIGATFDMMAERIQTETLRLSDQNTALEEAVGERTERLERLLSEARRTEASRRQMLSDVSHELRTPLTIIQGEADIALRSRQADVESYREALSRTRDAAIHTARLVDDLLFVARTAEGRVRLKLDRIDLVALLREASQHARANVHLEFSVERAEVRADPHRLSQVLTILLENAVHYGGTEVVLRLDQALSGWRIAVMDDGPGMSDDEKAHAFERFFRGSDAARRYGEGSGLGLPVALSIVEAHGGSMALEDRDGGGLAASLTLPTRPRLKAVQ
ncbi:MAG: HAMP domain-containing sensor histidine kinase, partial [Pseudomonadota bacterium]